MTTKKAFLFLKAYSERTRFIIFLCCRKKTGKIGERERRRARRKTKIELKIKKNFLFLRR